nr:hypothetical protein [Clostridia bacterium]
MTPFSFYVVADTHLFRHSLGCSGPEYDEYMRYQQKCFAETESINRMVFETLKKETDSDTVIFA